MMIQSTIGNLYYKMLKLLVRAISPHPATCTIYALSLTLPSFEKL